MKEGDDLLPSSKDAALRVIHGDRIDPADIDTTDEELEALALRLIEDQNVLDERWPATKLDPVINSLRSGFNIVEQWASAGNAYELPAVVDATVKWYIKRVQDTDPKGAYKFLAGSDASHLKFLAEAMFSKHIQDLITDNPSEAWTDQEVVNAVINGLGHSADVVRAMFPMTEGEDPKDYRERLITMMEEAAEEIAEQIDRVEF